MMNRQNSSNHNDNWSDFEEAKASAQRIFRGHNASAVDQHGSRSLSTYTKFRFHSPTPHESRKISSISEKEPEARDFKPPSGLDDTSKGFGPKAWNRFLSWCSDSNSGGSCFVMNSQGLMVASHGFDLSERVDTLGTRLMIAFEQAELMSEGDQDARSLIVEFSDAWLTGVKVMDSDRVTLTFGLLGSAIVPTQIRAFIAETLRASLGQSQVSLSIPPQ